MVNAKGIGYTLFTMTVITFLMIFLVQNVFIKTEYKEKTFSSFYRGMTLKEIKNAFESDLPRSMDVALKRALVEVINNETYDGRFYENVEEILHNLAYYGEYDGFRNDFIINNSVSAWMEKYNFLVSSKEVRVYEEVFDYYINLSFYDVIEYCYNLSYIIEDRLNQQGYKMNKILCSFSKIENFEDPYITIKSYENVISSFYVCPRIYGITESNAYGIAYIPTRSNLSFVQNKDLYILVVDSLSNYSDYSGFRGYVLKYNDTLPVDSSYVYDVNISLIENNTFIAYSDNSVWLTNQKLNEKSTTCYFAWDEGLNFIERLKGADANQTFKVATIISSLFLPPELDPGREYVLDIEML